MLELTADEARVLGVLIEKALTTPDQYPLTLNSIVAGASQRNNRNPIATMEEASAFDALESLRAKGLVVRTDSVGSRTNRYRHQAAETLHLRTSELALLAELLLRGPQTLGELRGRASRMHPLETLDETRGLLRGLADRPDPFVRDLPPEPGSRADRYAQTLCPDSAAPPPAAAELHDQAGIKSESGMEQRVAKLEAEVAELKDALRHLGALD